MNQFKPIFLGTVGETDDMAKLKRAVDSQKVGRTVVQATDGKLTNNSVSVLVASIM